VEGYIGHAILRLAALLPALTLHEFAHAYSAYRMGDPTPKLHGRVSLNPLAHLDPMGTLMILFAPIGWAKPVPVNPANFRDPAKGMLITSAAGPAANIAQGIFWGLVLRLALTVSPQLPHETSLLVTLLFNLTFINLILALFNLIPLGPLDGHSILEYFLPFEAKIRYRQFNQYGFAILIGLIFFSFVADVPILSYFLVRPALLTATKISGLG